LREVTRQEWEDVAQQLSDLADTLDALKAWGFEADWVLDGEKPPMVRIFGRLNQ